MDVSEQRGEIGRLERVALREVWPHEAHDFTRWLEENTDVVSEVVGFELQNVEREQAAGAFSVEGFAEAEELSGGSSWAMMVPLPACGGSTVSRRKVGQGTGNLRGVPSVRWSCGQRFPAEEAVLRRLA